MDPVDCVDVRCVAVTSMRLRELGNVLDSKFDCSSEVLTTKLEERMVNVGPAAVPSILLKLAEV